MMWWSTYYKIYSDLENHAAGYFVVNMNHQPSLCLYFVGVDKLLNDFDHSDQRKELVLFRL